MARRSSILERLRASSSRVLLGREDGPLTFGRRKREPELAAKRRESCRDDLEERLIMIHQLGQLPDLLAGYVPKQSANHSFSLDHANKLAIELGATVFHLIAAGAKVEGLSADKLAWFVSQQLAGLPDKDVGSKPEHAPPIAARTTPQVRSSERSPEPTPGGGELDEILRMLGEA